jgi:hypothetical protein
MLWGPSKRSLDLTFIVHNIACNINPQIVPKIDALAISNIQKMLILKFKKTPD